MLGFLFGCFAEQPSVALLVHCSFSEDGAKDGYITKGRRNKIIVKDFTTL